jgi:uncharacterized UBP type Zn finger protein
MSCEHLVAVGNPPLPPGPLVCPACVAEGYTDWVHLRQCLNCGQFGCCDSSPRAHATGHHMATGHPVMRSVERGEAWRWCYVDEELG